VLLDGGDATTGTRASRQIRQFDWLQDSRPDEEEGSGWRGTACRCASGLDKVLDSLREN
jgi:hypothetical protein